MKTVLITGASTGIGRAAAIRMAKSGWSVFVGVRNDKDAASIEAEDDAIHALILDVTRPDQIESAVEKISQELAGRTLNGLVNNAGIANMGPLALQPMEDIRAHFEVNVFGLIAMTKACLPLLGMDENRAGRPGRIVNISSVGGKLSAPFLGAYAATKHSVEAITDAFRRELLPYGIDAIAVGPGSVKTPIWDKAETSNKDRPYKGSIWDSSIETFAEVMLEGGRTGLPPEDVARDIEEALTSNSPDARYAPVPDKLTNWTIPRLLPKRMIDKAMAKRYGIKVKE